VPDFIHVSCNMNTQGTSLLPLLPGSQVICAHMRSRSYPWRLPQHTGTTTCIFLSRSLFLPFDTHTHTYITAVHHQGEPSPPPPAACHVAPFCRPARMTFRSVSIIEHRWHRQLRRRRRSVTPQTKLSSVDHARLCMLLMCCKIPVCPTQENGRVPLFHIMLLMLGGRLTGGRGTFGPLPHELSRQFQSDPGRAARSP
jgi:hypothetical protein